PVFTLTDNFFGDVDVRQPGFTSGYSVPYLVELEPGAEYTLLVGCERGFIFQYGNIDDNLTGTFLKVDSTYAEIYHGLRVAVSGGDIDADGKIELLVGNYRGGVTFYDDAPNVAVPPLSIDQEIRVYPNPASRNMQVDLPVYFRGKPFSLLISNSLGEKKFAGKYESTGNSLDIDVSLFPPGVYFIRLSDEKISFVGKVMISR
ncbi:MAG: T9SS type A sorting domain-containing protein, partial [Chitinophagales bacterium]